MIMGHYGTLFLKHPVHLQITEELKLDQVSPAIKRAFTDSQKMDARFFRIGDCYFKKTTV
jgi:hypothetical protein